MNNTAFQPGTKVAHRDGNTGIVIRSYNNVSGKLTYDVKVDGNTRGDGTRRWLAGKVTLKAS